MFTAIKTRTISDSNYHAVQLYLNLQFIPSCNVWYGPASFLFDAFLIIIGQQII